MRFLMKCLVLLLPLIGLSSGSHFNYPQVYRNESVIDEYFGVKVPDPYQWLEDLDSGETRKFVQEQNNLTQSFWAQAPARDHIRETLTKLWTYPKEGLPKQRGDNFFLFKSVGLQDQWILYRGKSLDEVYSDEAEVFIDPNTLSDDGTVSLRRTTFSKNSEVMTYTITRSGSDWNEVFLKNTTSGDDFPEVLLYTKFTSISWTHDNVGFFYTRYLTGNQTLHKDEKIFYHRVGTPQENDTLVVQFLDKPDWSLSMEVSDDGEYLVLSTYKVINEVYIYYAKIGEAVKEGFQNELELVQLTTKPALYSFIANDGPIFYFQTNEGAPNYKVIKMDIHNPDKKYWATLVPEHEKDVLAWASPIAQKLVLLSYTRDVKSTLELRNLANGTLIHEYDLEAGTISQLEGRREDNLFLFTFMTFTDPGVTYKLYFGENGELIPKELEFYRKTAFTGLDTSEFMNYQVFYTSKDGTKIPMFIVHKKDLVRSGNAPTSLYGYGGFHSSTEPYFSVGNLAFVSMFDGILAFANIRGGGEYGTKWWDAGRLFNKQNVFDDFIAAAEYLIAENYTSPSKLSITGSSNGGLLVAACVNQRPELFGAAIAAVGVMDMLRFQQFTVGSFWCGEYGCSEEKDHFENLIKYSPLHNIKNNTVYPAVLVTTADHDDRVVPSHSFKYISQLQYVVGNYENQTQPLLIRVEEKAGHGAGKPTSKQIEELVDKYVFLQLSLNYRFANTNITN